MKVLFANPPAWDGIENGRWRAYVRAGSRWPYSSLTDSVPDRPAIGNYIPAPLFLMYATTYARRAGAEVTFRDSIALRDSYATFMRFVREGDFDYLVMETATPSWTHDANLIQQMHKWCPRTKVVVTGTIATTRGEEILHHHPVHAVLKGEYEKGVVRVLNGESGLVEFDFLSTQEMNAAPPPYMDEMHAPLYFDANPRGQIHPQGQIWTSRGCWAKCAFCAFPATMTSDDPDGTKKRTVRHYTPDYLLSYLPDWIDRYGFKCLWVDDDLFTTSDRHVLATSETFRKIGIPWSAMCRADGIKRASWKAMKEAGCFAVKVGFESASQRVLDEIVNKRLDLKEAEETLRYLKSIGMVVHTTWMIGHPGETKDEQHATRAMIQRFYGEGLHQTHQLSGAASVEGTPMATLLTRGHLDKYPGAKVDEGYVPETDGQKKAERMSLELAK